MKTEFIQTGFKDVIVKAILMSIQERIEMFPNSHKTWNMDYWKGYCHALCFTHKIDENEAWKEIFEKANKLCA